MDINFEVKRRRQSVTQGSADVYMNGEFLITFGDDIKLIDEGQESYGENISGWASVLPDWRFVKGAMRIAGDIPVTPREDCRQAYKTAERILKEAL